MDLSIALMPVYIVKTIHPAIEVNGFDMITAQGDRSRKGIFAGFRPDDLPGFCKTGDIKLSMGNKRICFVTVMNAKTDDLVYPQRPEILKRFHSKANDVRSYRQVATVLRPDEGVVMDAGGAAAGGEDSRWHAIHDDSMNGARGIFTGEIQFEGVPPGIVLGAKV